MRHAVRRVVTQPNDAATIVTRNNESTNQFVQAFIVKSHICTTYLHMRSWICCSHSRPKSSHGAYSCYAPNWWKNAIRVSACVCGFCYITVIFIRWNVERWPLDAVFLLYRLSSLWGFNFICLVIVCGWYLCQFCVHSIGGVEVFLIGSLVARHTSMVFLRALAITLKKQKWPR